MTRQQQARQVLVYFGTPLGVLIGLWLLLVLTASGQ